MLLATCLHLSAQIPPVLLKDIDGKNVRTERIENGGNPIVICFFATWCKPCLRELNALHECYEEWQEETGVQLVAVSIDEGAHSFKVKPLARAQGWNFPVWLDSNKELMRAMNVNMVPAAFVLDGEKNIIHRHTGYVEGGETELWHHIKRAAR